MKIDLITCSDPREDTPPEKLVAFMNEFPNVEIGIQASTKQIGPGTARRAWFEKLMPMVRNNPRRLRMAMHVNLDYSDQMCRGMIPNDMAEWFNARRADGRPVIGRIQINGGGSIYRSFRDNDVAKMIGQNADREFIIQYDGGTRTLLRIEYLWCHRARFAILHDASGGNGISPEKWSAPFVFNRTGYSGGLRPENVTDELRKIAAVAGYADIWIDAEGGLKTPGTKTFDIDRAREYVRAANNWNRRFGR